MNQQKSILKTDPFKGAPIDIQDEEVWSVFNLNKQQGIKFYSKYEEVIKSPICSFCGCNFTHEQLVN